MAKVPPIPRSHVYNTAVARKNKYGNRRVEVDGYVFDSQKEAIRWSELRVFEKAGEISHLERQVKFELQPAFYNADGKKERAIYYVCDFMYTDETDRRLHSKELPSRIVIEDVKSKPTKSNPVYKMKKKMMAYRGYVIKEI